MLVAPRFVALDSSILGNLIRDAYRGKASVTNSAGDLLKKFDGSSCFLVLTHHHIEELLQHSDEEVALARLEYLESMPIVAVARSTEGGPGTILDLLCAEILVAYQNPTATAQDIRSLVRVDLFSLDNGRNALSGYRDNWATIRCMFKHRQQHAMQIAAIKFSDVFHQPKATLGDWLSGKVKSPQALARTATRNSLALQRDIELHRDRRMEDADALTRKFCQRVISEGKPFFSTETNDALGYFASIGFEPSEIDPSMTVSEFGELAQFRAQMQIANRSFELPWDELKYRVTPDRLPSVLVQRSLDRHGQGPTIRKGSELVDRYLIGFSPYMTTTFVDKRTMESVRRTTAKDRRFKDLCGRIVKARSWLDVLPEM